VHIMPAGRTSLTETEVEVTVNNATSLSEEMRNEIAHVLVAIGFATDERTALENASVEARINEWMDLAEAIDVSADEFDWQEAMRTELAWLRDKGVIAGLSDADIEEIAAACRRGSAGHNSRIVYEAGRWLPYYETSQPQLLRSSAGCSGFSLDALPEGTLENVPTTHEIMSEHTAVHRSVSKHTTFSPFGYVAIIGAMAVVGTGVLIWYRRGRR